MTPKARTHMADIRKWSRDNCLHLRKFAKHLQQAMNELPAELGELHAAVAECLKSSERLQQVTMDTLGSDELAKLAIPKTELTKTEESQLLALNRHLRNLTRHLRAVVDDVKPRLDAKLANPDDPMHDYEIEARIDYQLRERDPDFAEDDDNYLTSRTESLKSSLFGWEREVCPLPLLPAGLLVEPHCALFHNIYNESYGVEGPKLSFRDCLRIGSIFVDVQIWQQYELNAQDGTFTKTSSTTSPWSESLKQETRDTFKEMPVTADGRLHLKHPTEGYAYVKVEDLDKSSILIYRKPDGEMLGFDDLEALLQAGWALD